MAPSRSPQFVQFFSSRRGGAGINNVCAAQTFRQPVVRRSQWSLWSLWLFSASSALSSEKRNHKVAGTRRKVQSTKSIRVIANFVELDRSAAHAGKRGLDLITM